MMMRLRQTMAALAVVCLLIGLTAGAPASVQEKDKREKEKATKGEKKAKKNKDDADQSPTVSDRELHNVLWTEPANIESLDLFNGPGGADGAPDPQGKFTFEERVTSGTSEKIHVTDDKGRKWTVKFGPEARPETAATRIVWAAGYHVDQDYFVKRTHIEGRGGFDVWDVRFERRDDGYSEVKKDTPWSWHSNPFMGTRELQGLKVLMALLNNWDLKIDNNKVVHASKKSGGDRDAKIYYIADLGGTLGSTGSFFTKLPFFGNAPAGSKGEPDAFAGQAFIEGVRNGQVVFHYKGKDPKALEGVTVENARWMGDLLGRLSDKQLADAYRAGGFTDAEVMMYVKATRARIDQLKNLK
ncbi:MAG TPA: hypothetical protein VKA60_20260 [Blastocatellia bacterium]|nr:hypothetical protein [Blastocatellia bacterium]